MSNCPGAVFYSVAFSCKLVVRQKTIVKVCSEADIDLVKFLGIKYINSEHTLKKESHQIVAFVAGSRIELPTLGL